MGQRSSKFLSDIHFEEGASEEECKAIFEYFDVNKNGLLDPDESRKFLTKLFKYNTDRENSISLDDFIEQTMYQIDTDHDGFISLEELLAYRGSGLELIKKDESLLQGYTFETATALWNEFNGAEHGLTLPRSRGPSFLSSLKRSASSRSFPRSPSSHAPAFQASCSLFSGSSDLTTTSSFILTGGMSSGSSSGTTSSSSFAPNNSLLAPSFSLPFPAAASSSSLASSSSSSAATSSSSSKNTLSIIVPQDAWRNPTCSPSSLSVGVFSAPSAPPSPHLNSAQPSAPPSPRSFNGQPPKYGLSSSLSVPGAPEFNHSPSLALYTGVCRFVAHLLRHEQRYGRTVDDAQNLVKTLQARGLALELPTFRVNSGLAFEVIQEWRANDKLSQRKLKAADAKLMQLIRQTAMACDRSLLYAINEEVRPELTFLPYVLQTEVLQYISERDEKGSFAMKQNIVQLLYLMVWRTEEPGLPLEVYQDYISKLDTCVQMCRSIPVPAYVLRDEGEDSDVFLPPTTMDELEMERLQSRLLAALCHIYYVLTQALSITSMEQVKRQLPPLGVICFQCGVRNPTTTACVFHAPGCKCRRQVTSGCTLNSHNSRSLTCVARAIFGLGAKTLLASASNGALDAQHSGDRPFSQYTWARDIAAAERNQKHVHVQKLQIELKDIEIAMKKCLKDPLRPLRTPAP